MRSLITMVLTFGCLGLMACGATKLKEDNWIYAVVQGHVVDGEGKAWPGPQVTLHDYVNVGTEQAPVYQTLKLVSQSTCDEVGCFRLGGLRSGKYLLQVVAPAPDAPEGGYKIEQVVEVVAGETQDLEIRVLGQPAGQ